MLRLAKERAEREIAEATVGIPLVAKPAVLWYVVFFGPLPRSQ